MRPLSGSRSALRPSVVVAGLAAAILAPCAAAAGDSDHTPVPTVQLHEDGPGWGPAARAEVGMGAMYPSFGTPFVAIHAHAGFTYWFPSNLALSTGLDIVRKVSDVLRPLAVRRWS